MTDLVDSEEEWSEAELFDEPVVSHHTRRHQLGSIAEGRADPSGVSPAVSRGGGPARPYLGKLHTAAAEPSGSSPTEHDGYESTRSPYGLPRSIPSSPGTQPSHKRGYAYDTPDNTPRAEKAAQEFAQPAASCPVAIVTFGKKQHVAEQPVGMEVPSPVDQAFMPPHELLAQTLPEYDADVARLGFRPGSVMEGAGRKLQGRDAVQFRRAIMRQTGFLEKMSDERLGYGQSVPG